MQRLLGDVRRADEDYAMLCDGDRVLLGVSGGKDSMVLLCLLARYRSFAGKSFDLRALTLKMGEPFDVSPIAALCQALDVPYDVLQTDMLSRLFDGDAPRGKNPCALCARLRRGALVSYAKQKGCNVLALAHTADDAAETLLLSVLREGRLHTFAPKTFLENQGISVIRPLVYAFEKNVKSAAKRHNLPIIKNPCPVDGHTERRQMKTLLDTLCKTYPRARTSLLGALKNTEQYGLWEKEHPCPNK